MKFFFFVCGVIVGHWVPMCAFIAIAFIRETDKDLAILLLVIAVGINSSTYLGFQVCIKALYIYIYRIDSFYKYSNQTISLQMFLFYEFLIR